MAFEVEDVYHAFPNCRTFKLKFPLLLKLLNGKLGSNMA
jgi:hypothetical protein